MLAVPTSLNRGWSLGRQIGELRKFKRYRHMKIFIQRLCPTQKSSYDNACSVAHFLHHFWGTDICYRAQGVRVDENISFESLNILIDLGFGTTPSRTAVRRYQSSCRKAESQYRTNFSNQRDAMQSWLSAHFENLRYELVQVITRVIREVLRLVSLSILLIML